MRQIICLVLALMILGCEESNRYELTKDAKGRTVRLDKKTGELALVEDNRVTPIKEPNDFDEDAFKLSALEVPTIWPEITIRQKGNITVRITTSWRDEKLAYKFAVTPASPQLEESLRRSGRAQFTATFYDLHGFQIAEIPILLSEMMRIVNEKDDTQGFEQTNSVPLSSASYQRIKKWTVLWNF